ncbi:aromatic prenyltransferase [Aspergillus varians]
MTAISDSPVNDKSASTQDNHEYQGQTAISPFNALDKYLSIPTNDQKQWWQLTGSLLGRMLRSAQYPVDQQYQYLTFFDRHIAPRLGPYPPRFRSSITVSGQPIELSINYQQYGPTQPVVRIGFEALDTHSGTERDPFNQLPASGLISSLSSLGLKGFDPALFFYFGHRHTVNVEEKAQLQGPLASRVRVKSQHGFGADLKNGTVLVKGYTFPGLKTVASGQSMSSLMTDSIFHLPEANPGQGQTCRDAWAVIDDYLSEVNGYNDLHLFSWDYVAPSNSRLKFYAVSIDLTWRKVQEVWTLNHRTATHAPTMQGLIYLRQLWDFIKPGASERELPEDRPAHVKDNETPLLWNYEMTPGSAVPLAKLYFSLHGVSDLDCARNLARFFEAVGWEELATGYLDTVKSYFPGYDLSKTSHLIMWVSFAYSEKTGVYLSVYYHSSGNV